MPAGYIATNTMGLLSLMSLRAQLAWRMAQIRLNNWRVTIPSTSTIAQCQFGGSGTSSTAGETVFGRILAGKKPQWTGRLDQPHTFHYLPDVARGLLVLADRPAADGQIWHLPAAEPLTARQFFNLAAEAAGRPTPVKANTAGPALLAVAGVFSPLLREMRETTYQFRAPFVVDATKFETTLGHLEPTPHRIAVQETINWYRSR